MNQQDWKPVVFVKSESRKRAESRKVQVTKHNAPGTSKLRTLDEDDFSANNTVNHSLRLSVQKTRTSLGMTQKQLASVLNVPVSIISEYESGKTKPSPSIMSKLNNMAKKHGK
jgi:ribosome-binding protein aMBF1 (putative translation factor)